MVGMQTADNQSSWEITQTPKEIPKTSFRFIQYTLVVPMGLFLSISDLFSRAWTTWGSLRPHGGHLDPIGWIQTQEEVNPLGDLPDFIWVHSVSMGDPPGFLGSIFWFVANFWPQGVPHTARWSPRPHGGHPDPSWGMQTPEGVHPEPLGDHPNLISVHPDSLGSHLDFMGFFLSIFYFLSVPSKMWKLWKSGLKCGLSKKLWLLIKLKLYPEFENWEFLQTSREDKTHWNWVLVRGTAQLLPIS